MLNKSTTFEEFSALLMQEHGVAVKESRGRLSYCPPGRTKFITAKKLSKKLEKEQVLTALSQNIQLAAIIQPACEQKPDKIRKLVDIQAKAAAGKGIGYERWAKKFNLKRWSQTLILLQEKGLTSEDALHQRIAELQTQHDDALTVVKDMDARMVSLKELRGHLVVYRQYKPLAQKLQTVRNPAKFKEQHRAEFAVYEAACAYFKANGSGHCRTSKSWMPNIRPFPRRKTGSTPATRKRRSNCVNSAPHNRTWKTSSARRSATTPYRSRRLNEQHSDGSMCE